MKTWLQVYGTDGPNDYRANCKSPESAGFLVALLGEGATVRQGKDVLWTEGKVRQGDLAVQTIREKMARGT